MATVLGSAWAKAWVPELAKEWGLESAQSGLALVTAWGP